MHRPTSGQTTHQLQSHFSLALALALAEDGIDVESCIVASQVDDIFQIEQWGKDEHITARLAGLTQEVRVAARILGLLETQRVLGSEGKLYERYYPET